ncbi:LLM class flavin-dependent oxidoreductase [Rhodococcus hoagii]|nr:LLM class flavin-dependent oxidoreductase [Prescottella equi]
MAAVVKASESAGFVGGFAPVVPDHRGPVAAASALARESDTYRFMVAFQPGFLHPVQAARMSASLQRATGGRLVYNIISGGGEHRSCGGVTRSRTTTATRAPPSFRRAARCGTGRRSTTTDASSAPKVPHCHRCWRVSRSRRCSSFLGSSGAAVAAAGAHAATTCPGSSRSRGPARQVRRCPRAFREARTNSEVRGAHRRRRAAHRGAAWPRSRRGGRSSIVRPPTVPRRVIRWELPASRAGCRRTPGYRDLEVQPNVWCGFSLIRGGPAFGLVGSYEQVAERLDQLIDLGVDAFILAGNPHLEEAYRVGEDGVPLSCAHHTHPGRQSFRPIGAVP